MEYYDEIIEFYDEIIEYYDGVLKPLSLPAQHHIEAKFKHTNNRFPATPAKQKIPKHVEFID